MSDKKSIPVTVEVHAKGMGALPTGAPSVLKDIEVPADELKDQIENLTKIFQEIDKERISDKGLVLDEITLQLGIGAEGKLSLLSLASSSLNGNASISLKLKYLR